MGVPKFNEISLIGSDHQRGVHIMQEQADTMPPHIANIVVCDIESYVSEPDSHPNLKS